MTEPKINTIKRGDTRFYVEPTSGAKYPGVTSVLNMLPKPFLTAWAAKMTAEFAVEDIGAIVTLAMRDKQAAIDLMKGASKRFTAEAARVGSEAHAVFEALSKNEDPGRLAPDIQPYSDHFKDFLDKVQPEYIYLEETVWSDTHRYAGSFDALAKIDGELVWIDNKTTRSGIHAEVGVQLAAYAAADFILKADGTHVEMPQSEVGACLHIRPEGWKLVPVRADRQLFETVFLPLRAVMDYDYEVQKTIIGKPAFEGVGTDSAPKRRAPRKAATD